MTCIKIPDPFNHNEMIPFPTTGAPTSIGALEDGMGCDLEEYFFDVGKDYTVHLLSGELFNGKLVAVLQGGITKNRAISGPLGIVMRRESSSKYFIPLQSIVWAKWAKHD